MDGGKHPGEAGDDAGRRGGEGQGQAGEHGILAAAHPGEYAPERQPDQHEDQRLQEEHHESPDGQRVGPGAGVEGLVLAPPQHQPAGHHCQHPRGMDLLGREVSEVGDEEGHHRRRVRILQAPDRPVGGEAEGHSYRDARRGEPREAAERREGVEGPGQGGGDGEAVEHEAGGVVDQALALQHRHRLAGQGHPRQHRLGRHGVRRGDDGAECEARRPGQARHHPVGHQPDHQGREHHRPQRQGQDRAEGGAKVPPDGEVGRFEQQRRQK